MGMVKVVVPLLLATSYFLSIPASAKEIPASAKEIPASAKEIPASAKEIHAPISTKEVSEAEQAKIKAAIKHAIPELPISSVSVSFAPLAGFYQLTSGVDVFYVSQDGSYVFYGSLLDLSKDKKTWDLTEAARSKKRKELIADINQQDMIIFSPQGEVKSTVMVFTDIDCIFCQKFHKNIKEILALGLEVRYIAFPRAKVDSVDYNKTVSIWCADDKAAMLTLAKAGGVVPTKQCSGNVVATQAKLGERLGIKGTPTIVFADGFMQAGYLEPKDLIKIALEHN